ncbi:MAG: TatD family hydrolase [Desulfobacterales bacterium]|nr:TatD family hydrolase [Desulfobacterales bacterium]
MKIFDSHCHIDDESYEKDFDLMLTRAKEADVHAMMVVGITKESSNKAVLMAEKYSCIYASVGIHPHDASDCNEETISFLCNLSKNPKVCAWGEIGLDFNRMYSPKQEQEKWFERQLEIACKLNLPVIFHERDTNGRFLEILKHNTKEKSGVVHCFNGNKEELFSCLDLGLCIGITGILTIKSRGEFLRAIAKLIPKERIVIETDSPYLTPFPQKKYSKRNEPAFVRSVLLELANIKKEDAENLSHVIWENTCKLYRIKL